jgi:hypothetical protein
MPFYRFNPQGLSRKERIKRLDILNDHLETWNVGITHLYADAQVVWIRANIDIPESDFVSHFGFSVVRSDTQPELP